MERERRRRMHSLS
jgi:hypothetical protein